MVAIAAALLFFFWRKGWLAPLSPTRVLGDRRPKPDEPGP
jgi:hypothetical protein